jgi:hypothetical protein
MFILVFLDRELEIATSHTGRTINKKITTLL